MIAYNIYGIVVQSSGRILWGQDGMIWWNWRKDPCIENYFNPPSVWKIREACVRVIFPPSDSLIVSLCLKSVLVLSMADRDTVLKGCWFSFFIDPLDSWQKSFRNYKWRVSLQNPGVYLCIIKTRCLCNASASMHEKRMFISRGVSEHLCAFVFVRPEIVPCWQMLKISCYVIVLYPEEPVWELMNYSLVLSHSYEEGLAVNRKTQ